MAQTLKGKRRRAEESLPDRISNRSKSTGTARMPTNFPPEFYDSLSKIWLTPRALRELDRRNEKLPPSHSKPAADFVKPRGAKLAALARLGVSKPAQFAASGGPDLSDLKGYPEPTNVSRSMASPRLLNRDTASLVSSNTRQTRPTGRRSATSKKSRRTSAYDDNFEQHCLDYCIYFPRHRFSNGMRPPKPKNLEEIRKALKKPGPSLFPSTVHKTAHETAHEDFLDKLPGATEGDLVRRLIPLLVGDTDIPNSGNCMFTNLISRTGDTTVTLKPDYFEGALLEDVDTTVRQSLNNQIIPTKNAETPIVPNFFLEFKNNAGKMKVAERQTTMNGVQGAYIMHALQNYLPDEKPEYDGKAYAFTATLVDTYLRLYAHHLIAPTQRGKQPGCYATLLKAYALDDEEAYLTGRTAFRNLRMRAKEDRDRFIASANARARRQNTADEDVEEDIDDDGSTERGDNFSRAGEEQQDQGSSPLNFYDAHTFIEPGRDTQDAAQDATQETQNITQDSQLNNAGVALDYNTDDAEIGIEGTSSFTSVSYEDYRRPRRQIKRVRSPLASSSTRQTPRNAASSSTRKRARSPPSPPVTRQRKRRLESAG
ncbi:hypothetical protein TGAM01_v201894 [Trichoderma gamsii]|uniref:DUF7924 domain-containing protein n=1 Tax=Trichoderma gamsii TaxID=398673 RepID=A0A2P4ZZC4_9HYPO|nr:hypothetical protein TGAM01_v201894 [Trichoderma gamsii]PON29645.1 hypothetical protein TGAM01_v201894 [Trichoderma gamsii]